eukprot:CAMPEP_0185019794 /NCGR_PEP_ID=MMETSP1103-20130426/2373_1 /TAXON_ID=36769 /ORGANISM="Paraphysomonas bandaiensis, Strain Caron Lab Isolate" /LENGTH=886 /DNA_ID=CAMNT_0027550277 /DNA_START=174 /DNA_END=2834 /DNA_ORIENTATION=-
MLQASQLRRGSLLRSYSSLPRATPAIYTSISDLPTNLKEIVALKELGATTATNLYHDENHTETTVFVLMYNESYQDLVITLHGIAANIRHAACDIGPVKVVVIVDGIKRKSKDPSRPDHPIIHTDLIPTIQRSSENGFIPNIDTWEAHREKVLDENYRADPSNPNFILQGHWPIDHHLGVLDMAIVVKDLNQGKAHSHCLACYSARSRYIMFVDCGTVLDAPCLRRMIAKMNSDRQIIGLTARQRAHVLEPMARWLFAKESRELLPKRDDDNTTGEVAGRHLNENTTREHEPILSEANKSLPSLYEWLFSVVPLQVAEFEATFHLNMEAFNMIGSLPVLPGPCQLYDLEPMIEKGVIDKYFQLTQDILGMEEGSLFERMIWSNARLAEDRILSFIVTAMTGMRTHITTGTCFYYDPMRCIMSLFKQRRRWINGTEVINTWLLLVNAGNKMTGTRYIANKAFLFFQLWQSVVVLLSPIVVIYAIATALIYLDKSTGKSIWRYIGYFLGWSWFVVVVSWTTALTPWCTEKLKALGSCLRCSYWCEPSICYIADHFPFGLLRWCLKTDDNGVVIRNKETGTASLADYEKTVVVPIAVISIVVSGCIMIYLTGAFFYYTYWNGFSFFQVVVLLISLCPFILAFLKCEPSTIWVYMSVYIQYALALLFYNYMIAFYALANIHDVSWSSDGTESTTQAVNEGIRHSRNFSFDCCCLKISVVDIAAFFHITEPKHLTNLLCMTFTIFNIVLGVVCVLAVDPEYGGGNSSNLINQRALVVALFFIFLTPVFVNIIAVCISTLKKGCVFMTNERQLIERTVRQDVLETHLEYNKMFDKKMQERLDELNGIMQLKTQMQEKRYSFDICEEGNGHVNCEDIVTSELYNGNDSDLSSS